MCNLENIIESVTNTNCNEQCRVSYLVFLNKALIFQNMALVSYLNILFLEEHA